MHNIPVDSALYLSGTDLAIIDLNTGNVTKEPLGIVSVTPDVDIQITSRPTAFDSDDDFPIRNDGVDDGDKHGQADIVNITEIDVFALFEDHGTVIQERGLTEAIARTAYGGTTAASSGFESLIETDATTGPFVVRDVLGAIASNQGDGEFAQASAGIDLFINNDGVLFQDTFAQALARVIPEGKEFRYAEAQAQATKEVSFTDWEIGCLFSFEYSLLQIFLGADPEGILSAQSSYLVNQSTTLGDLWTLYIESDTDQLGASLLTVDFASHMDFGFDDLFIEQQIQAGFAFDPILNKWIWTQEDFSLISAFHVGVENWTWYTDVEARAYAAYTPIPEPSTMLLLCIGLIGLAGLRRKFKNEKT